LALASPMKKQDLDINHEKLIYHSYHINHFGGYYFEARPLINL